MSVEGMKKATFIGRIFAGSKDLFEEAKESGEIYEDSVHTYTSLHTYIRTDMYAHPQSGQ